MYRRLRNAVRTQLRLQERYAARWDLSGRETAAAMRRLRWHGDELVGCELPPLTTPATR
jgi:hypothetical protein